MLKIVNSGRGFAHIGIILLLLAIGIGVFLVSQKTNLKPKASAETIQIVDDSGNPVTTTTSQTVRVKLSPETNLNYVQEAGRATVSEQKKSNLEDSDADGFIDSVEQKIGTSPKYVCPSVKKNAIAGWPPDINNDSYINGGDVSSLVPYMGPNPQKKYNKRYDLNADKKINEQDVQIIQQYFLRTCKDPLGTVSPTPTPTPSNKPSFSPTIKPTPSSSPSEKPLSVPIGVTLGEDPNYTINYYTVPYNAQNPIIDYTFSTSNPGKKLIYAYYTYSNGANVNAVPFPLIVELQSTSSPMPSSPISPSPVTDYLKVIYPNGGESVKIGDTVRIKWESNYTNYDVGIVRLDGTVKVLAAIKEIPERYLDWVVDESFAGQQLKVRVAGYNYSNPDSNEITDNSDNLFNVMPIPSPSPTATFKRVFVTSSKYDGNLGGFDGADLKCQNSAKTAGLGGTWKAWLSSNSRAASTRLVHSSLQYRLLNNVIVAFNWTDLSDGTLEHPINTTENSTALGLEQVWTGTTAGGFIKSDKNCNEWTSNIIFGYKGSTGRTTDTNSGWTDYYQLDCNQQARLYCFEQ